MTPGTRMMAECLCGGNRGYRHKPCTIVKVIRESHGAWALVRFDNIDRVYVKRLTGLRPIKPPNRGWILGGAA